MDHCWILYFNKTARFLFTEKIPVFLGRYVCSPGEDISRIEMYALFITIVVVVIIVIIFIIIIIIIIIIIVIINIYYYYLKFFIVPHKAKRKKEKVPTT